MDHDKTLPVVVETTARTQHVSRHSRARVLLSALFVLAAVQCARVASTVGIGFSHATVNVPLHAEEALSKCRLLEVPPGPSPSFHSRSQSDRFVPGTKATLITVGRHSAAGCEGLLLTRPSVCRTRPYGREEQTVSRSSMATFSSTVASSSVSVMSGSTSWLSTPI